MSQIAEAMAKHEQSAEAAYEAMYAARPHLVKYHYEEACGHFSRAIDLAKSSGLEGERVRLEARRQHVADVYDHQFRGVG